MNHTNVSGGGGKKRRRFSKITHEISDALWVRIMKLSVQLKKSPREIYDDLVLQVSDAEARFLVIKPQNGEKAGIAMEEVGSTLAACSMALRDTVGLGHRFGNPDTTAKLEKAYAASLDLWAAAQRLGSETFYAPADFEDMRLVHSLMVDSRNGHLKKIDEEENKSPGDQAKIVALKRQVAKYEVVIRVLKRLGCADQHAN